MFMLLPETYVHRFLSILSTTDSVNNVVQLNGGQHIVLREGGNTTVVSDNKSWVLLSPHLMGLLSVTLV